MNDEHFFFPILLGTARDERRSEQVARILATWLADMPAVETELIDVRDISYSQTVAPWNTGGTEETPTDWQRTMAKADGLVIVSPEYNRGYPGELKLALDSLYDEYARKPVALCGVSAGGFGGSRVIQHLQPVMTELKMLIVPTFLLISRVKDAFDESGAPTDPELKGRAEKMFNELAEYAQAAKTLRTETHAA